jgi:hypothetical protein
LCRTSTFASWLVSTRLYVFAFKWALMKLILNEPLIFFCHIKLFFLFDNFFLSLFPSEFDFQLLQKLFLTDSTSIRIGANSAFRWARCSMVCWVCNGLKPNKCSVGPTRHTIGPMKLSQRARCVSNG